MNTTPRTTTRARHAGYAQRVSELADDAVRAAARAYRVATALLDLLGVSAPERRCYLEHLCDSVGRRCPCAAAPPAARSAATAG